MRKQLSNKRILVTGTNGQLGKGLVQALSSRGAVVIATDVQEQPIYRLPRNAVYRCMDVTNEEAIQAVSREFKKIDALVNNAGIAVFTPFERRTQEEVLRVLSVNVLGTILCSKVFSTGMRTRRSGAIVNIGSIYGVVPPDSRIYGTSGRNSSEVYGASKAGVIQLTRYLASYLGRYKIRVNVVSPGGIFNRQHKTFVRRYTDKVPLGRMAAVEDIASAVAFLCGEDARYVTGQNMIVDGGFTLNQ